LGRFGLCGCEQSFRRLDAGVGRFGIALGDRLTGRNEDKAGSKKDREMKGCPHGRRHV
jgi:hypothetical protein